MMAITIWQPWASLIIAGAKWHEWRTWPIPRELVGKRVIVHAATRPARRKEIAELIQDLRSAPEEKSMDARIALPLLERWHMAPLSLPHAAGIGTVVVGNPIRATTHARNIGMDVSLVDPGKWGWPMGEPRPFAPVVPAPGQRGFWLWPGREP